MEPATAHIVHKAGNMAAPSGARDPVVVERLQQLIGAIRMMHKMMGEEEEQTWIAESASSASVSGPDAAKNVFLAAVKNLSDVTAKCTYNEATRSA